MDALEFLDHTSAGPPRPVYVIHGDEDFLKRRVRVALRDRILGDDAEFALATHAGDSATLAGVLDDLATLPFLAPHRLVVVEDADPFVTQYRAQLEKYVTAPAAKGVLVLDVKSWTSTTRLAKLVPSEATLVCKGPAAHHLPTWCVRWAAAQYGKQLTANAAQLLVDLVGADMGLLDQELAKLAVYVGDAKRIDNEAVDQLVGSSRSQTIWKVFGAIGGGRPGEALAILGQVCDQGEEPIRTLGAFSMQLRRLAQAYRLNQQGRPLGTALTEAGVPAWGMREGEQLLRHLGGRRAERLYDWLLDTDLGLKGGSLLPPRTLLERLVVRLARK